MFLSCQFILQICLFRFKLFVLCQCSLQLPPGFAFGRRVRSDALHVTPERTHCLPQQLIDLRRLHVPTTPKALFHVVQLLQTSLQVTDDAVVDTPALREHGHDGAVAQLRFELLRGALQLLHGLRFLVAAGKKARVQLGKRLRRGVDDPLLPRKQIPPLVATRRGHVRAECVAQLREEHRLATAHQRTLVVLLCVGPGEPRRVSTHAPCVQLVVVLPKARLQILLRHDSVGRVTRGANQIVQPVEFLARGRHVQKLVFVQAQTFFSRKLELGANAFNNKPK